MASARALGAIAAVVAAALGGSVSTAAQAAAKPRLTAYPAAAIRHGNEAEAHSPQVLRMLARQRAVSPAAQMTQGIDVSDHQHVDGATINWPLVAAAGYKFAFIKATEGSYYVNPYYASDSAAARRAGLFTAAYHFAIPNDSSGTLQADLAVDAAGATTGGRNLPLILDIEYDPYTKEDHTKGWCYGLSPSAMVAWVSAFVDEVQRRTGELPVIYSTAQWWNRCTGRSTAFSADPLWIAAYGASPELPVGWRHWNYWQYSSTAKVPGISVPTDVSYFNTASLTPVVPATQAGTAGSSASLAMQSLNADAGQSLTWSASGLPPGMSVDPPSGAISGTLPSVPASYPVTVTMTDAALSTTSVSFTWDVHGPVSLGTPGRQVSAAGSASNLKLVAADGLPGCTLTFTATGLPPGLSISPCGRITGWAYRPGHYQVTVHARDSQTGSLASVAFRWVITSARLVPAGQIRLGSGSNCLTAFSARRGTHPAPQVRACGAGASQRWQVSLAGVLRLGTRCLSVISTASSGYVPVLRPCSGLLPQAWQQAADGGLVNTPTGLCLTHAGGTGLDVAGCADVASQAWDLPAGPLGPDVAGKCVASVPASASAPAHLSLTECAATPRQAWTLGPSGTIAVGGRCLTTAQPGTVSAPVTLATCGTSTAQAWEAIPGRGGVPGSGTGGTLIVNPASGLCLTAADGTAAPTTALALGYCVTANPRLAWRAS